MAWLNQALPGCILAILGCAVLAAPAAELQAAAIHRAQLENYSARCAEMESTLGRALAQGNLLTQFRRMDSTDRDERFLMLMLYYRGSYLAFPHRLYVADAMTVIPGAEEGPFFPAFVPPPGWLAAHDTHWLMIIERYPDQSLHFSAVQL